MYYGILHYEGPAKRIQVKVVFHNWNAWEGAKGVAEEHRISRYALSLEELDFPPPDPHDTYQMFNTANSFRKFCDSLRRGKKVKKI